MSNHINLICKYKDIAIFQVPNVIFDNRFIHDVQHMKRAVSLAKHIPIDTLVIDVEYDGDTVLTMFGNISKN